MNSLKELLTHILIVTIGILIALGLEGLRETIHERGLVSEAREGFHSELELNHGRITKEIANVRETQLAIDAALKALHSAGRSGQLAALLDPIRPSLYFMQNTSWDAALPPAPWPTCGPKR